MKTSTKFFFNSKLQCIIQGPGLQAVHSLKPKGSLGSQSLEPLKATPKNSPRKSSGRNLLLPQYSQVSLLIEGQNKVEAVRVFLMLHHVNQTTTDLYIPIVPNIHIKSIREIRRNALQSCFPFCSDFCGEKKIIRVIKLNSFTAGIPSVIK